MDDAVDVPAPQEPEQEVAKVARRPSLSSGTLTPPDMIIPLQSGEGNKQPSESATGERVTASSPVNEDGNVSSEPELAADSSGEEGQGYIITEQLYDVFCNLLASLLIATIFLTSLDSPLRIITLK